MNLDGPYHKTESFSDPLLRSGRACTHCERRVERLRSEDSCPETYRCLFCKSLWIVKGHLILRESDLDGMSNTEWDAMHNDDSFSRVFILLD